MGRYKQFPNKEETLQCGYKGPEEGISLLQREALRYHGQNGDQQINPEDN